MSKINRFLSGLIWLLIVFYPLLIVYGQSALMAQTKSDSESLIMLQSQKFRYILETLYKNYVDSVDIKEISEAAFNAMLQKLDKQSIYYDQAQTEKIKSSLQGNKVGIGIKVQVINDSLRVVDVADNSPAQGAGLMRGDIIIALNEKNVQKLDMKSISDEMNGERGSQLIIDVISQYDNNPDRIKVIRDSFPLRSLTASFILPDLKIAYFDFDNISKSSYDEFADFLKTQDRDEINGIVIDLRGNSGGSLDQSAKIAGEFVPYDSIITKTDSRNDEFKMIYKSEQKLNLKGIPLIILIDKASASGSEIIAGAVQDYDRGLVVGEQSFGKGSVQKFWDFRDGSSFRATVAKYYTPSGRDIQKSDNYTNNTQQTKDTSGNKQLNNAIKAAAGQSVLPVFRTLAGRMVLGGGGIIPDHVVMKDTTSQLTQVLNQKGILLEFALNYIQVNREIIERKYKSFLDFNTKFELNQQIIDEFINFAKSRKVWNDGMYQSDKHIIEAMIKATIANVLWGYPGLKSVMLKHDKVFQKAIEVLPEAKNFADKVNY